MDSTIPHFCCWMLPPLAILLYLIWCLSSILSPFSNSRFWSSTTTSTILTVCRVKLCPPLMFLRLLLLMMMLLLGSGQNFTQELLFSQPWYCAAYDGGVRQRYAAETKRNNNNTDNDDVNDNTTNTTNEDDKTTTMKNGKKTTMFDVFRRTHETSTVFTLLDMDWLGGADHDNNSSSSSSTMLMTMML